MATITTPVEGCHHLKLYMVGGAEPPYVSKRLTRHSLLDINWFKQLPKKY